MLRFIKISTVLSTMVVFTSCGLFGDGTQTIKNSARFEKYTEVASLPPQSALSKSSVKLADDDFRSTPTNLGGNLSYAFLSLGDLGPGMFRMMWLESGEPVHFDLSSPTTISSSIVVPASEDDMPPAKKIIRAELYFNYVDATFQAGPSGESYVIRTVYAKTATADDVTGTMVQGDKLILIPSEEKFCWANAQGISQNRAEIAEGIYQDLTVTEYVQPSQGSSSYIPVTANFLQELPVSYDLITQTDKVWILRYVLDDAIVWSANPEGLTEPQDIVAAFRLKFGPNQSTTYGEEDDGIRASFKIE